MLVVSDLSVRGLSPFSFDLRGGECIALEGPSGSGKSLLLRALADLDPNDGEVSFEGVDRRDISGPAWRQQVVYLATDAGWWARHVRAHFENWELVAEEAESLGLAADCTDWPIGRLSNGEKQRLALLRALAVGPKVLLLDEPTSALDSDSTFAVEALIERRRRAGLAVIWVSHDGEQGRRVARRSFRIHDGAVVPL
jgi:putative ABC transport system ATP-binding protein